MIAMASVADLQFPGWLWACEGVGIRRCIGQ